MKLVTCTDSAKDYLCCDYNRDGDSYRSPWSGEYNPPNPDGNRPPPGLRKLEIAMNDAFDIYRHLYYEGGASSVYIWEQDGGFAGVVLLKKESQPGSGSAGWDSIHVFDVQELPRKARYSLTSTIMLYMSHDGKETMEIAGNMTRDTTQELAVTDQHSHVENLGRMIEDMEFIMRNFLQEVYFGKTKDVVNGLRSSERLSDLETERKQQQVLGPLFKKLYIYIYVCVSVCVHANL